MKKLDSLTSAKTDHIFHMTDDTGMFQHCVYGVPNLSKGYTSDDNCRALIMAVMMYEEHHTDKVAKLIYRYVSFLGYAQNEDGTFRNFMEYNREFLEEKGSDDCFGRCLWAVCFAYTYPATPENVRKALWKIIEKALPNCTDISSPRAQAYAVIGLSYLDTRDSNTYLAALSSSLAALYKTCSVAGWRWFEDSMTYCNAVLPWSMFLASKTLKKDSYKKIAIESMDFLESVLFRNGYFKPVGCDGWLQKGGVPAEYDEQPVEAAESVLAYLAAYDFTGKESYLRMARKSFAWYTGSNSKNISLIDPETGGCYDGIERSGLNHNQGAESVVSYWIASLAIQKHID